MRWLPVATALVAAILGARAEDMTSQRNPISAIPLSALSATRDRPLFVSTRRPPPVALAAAPALTAPPPIEANPSESERPPFALVGTIVGRDARLALLRNSSTHLVTRLREGNAEMGWLARTVNNLSIVMEKGENVKTLALPSPGSAPIATEASESGARAIRPDH